MATCSMPPCLETWQQVCMELRLGFANVCVSIPGREMAARNDVWCGRAFAMVICTWAWAVGKGSPVERFPNRCGDQFPCSCSWGGRTAHPTSDDHCPSPTTGLARGFGFITFPDDATAAAARRAMDGHLVDDLPLIVRMKGEPSSGPAFPMRRGVVWGGGVAVM